MEILTKRAYDEASSEDGYRALVDRLWPRGVKKEILALDEWCKDVAPSGELRKWFDHDPARFDEFSARYEDELAKSAAGKKLLKNAKKYNKLTLVYAAKDPVINHAQILKKYLERVS